MLRTIARHAKAISLIAGFLFGTLGAAWSFVFDDRLNEEMRQLSDTKADLVIQVDALNSTASEYFIANQQGDLIFLLAGQENVDQDLATLIYKGNMLDRATPVRNMIGALALAGQLDYRQTYDAYVELNEAARASFSLEDYTRLIETEQAIITQGTDRVPGLLKSLAEIEAAINANRAAQQDNRVIGLISSIFGSLLLLAANLVAESGRGKREKG
jgi:hypothetical protein